MTERSGVGSVVTVDEGKLVGFETDGDIVCRGIARRLARENAEPRRDSPLPRSR